MSSSLKPAPIAAFKLWQTLAVAVALGVVVWFFHWTVKSAGGFNPPGEEDYYNFLVRGWRDGHLHLSKEPRPEMLALADPYDPAQNRDVRLGDASYFKGHYYLYFGAGPAAVLLAPYYFLTGKELGTTTAIFVFCVTGYLAMSGVWLALRRRYFPESGGWMGPAGVVVLGLGTHLLALQRRPLVWELPIASAFAFTMLAFAAAYWVLHGKRPVLAMGLAGLGVGLAVTARPTYLLGAIWLLPVWWCLRGRLGAREWKAAAIAAGSALALCVAAVLLHNYARFGNALEFGQNYQLTSVYESRMRHFHWSYVPHNAYLYGFHPVTWSAEFPFLRATAVRGGPAGYLGEWNEAVCGLAFTLPFVWLVAGLPFAARDRPAGEASSLRAFIGATALQGAVMGVVILAYFLATPRYSVDFAPALGLLAMIGALGLERWIQGRAGHGIVTAAMAGAFVATVIAGALISLDYHNQSLRSINPPVWEKLERLFGGGP